MKYIATFIRKEVAVYQTGIDASSQEEAEAKAAAMLDNQGDWEWDALDCEDAEIDNVAPIQEEYHET